MNKRHREIYFTINKLGGQATAGEIAEAMKLSVNGITQSLNVMPGIHHIEGKGKQSLYKLDQFGHR